MCWAPAVTSWRRTDLENTQQGLPQVSPLWVLCIGIFWTCKVEGNLAPHTEKLHCKESHPHLALTAPTYSTKSQGTVLRGEETNRCIKIGPGDNYSELQSLTARRIFLLDFMMPTMPKTDRQKRQMPTNMPIQAAP